MSTRDDLEAEVKETWRRETLAIYADHLQSIGDPRGELIALDMSGQWSTERRASIEAWLGDSLPTRWHSELQMCVAGPERSDDLAIRATFEDGFSELVVASHWSFSAEERAFLDKFFASRAAPYLRRVRISAYRELIVEVLDLLASSRHDWLQSLQIRRNDVARRGQPAIADTAWLAAAMPHLKTLDVAGSYVLAGVAHPQITAVRATSRGAIDLLGCNLPALRELDVAFLENLDPSVQASSELPDANQLPALEDLRFAREEPGWVHVFPALAELRLRPARMDLPSLRSRDDEQQVQRMLDAQPQLQRVVIAREFAEHGHWGSELRHPTAHIVLPDRALPWPAPEPTESVEFGGIDISLASLVAHCQATYDNVHASTRSAWDRIWAAVRAAETEDVGVTTRDLEGVLSEATDHELARIQRTLRRWLNDPYEDSHLAVERSRRTRASAEPSVDDDE